jgi:hypothetical protein
VVNSNRWRKIDIIGCKTKGMCLKSVEGQPLFPLLQEFGFGFSCSKTLKIKGLFWTQEDLGLKYKKDYGMKM